MDNREIPKAEDRLEVLRKIEEYEKKGLFHLDVENDPPWRPLNPDKLDLTNKKFRSRIKTRFGNFMAVRYYSKLLRKKAIIYSGVKGLENLDGFEGGAIVTCNHMHQFDNYAAFLSLKQKFTKRGWRLWKVVREGNFTFPGIVGFFMRNCNTLPVNERENQNIRLTGKTMQAIKELLEKGEKVLVFAEQGMWWNYRKPRPLKKGAFMFAAKFNSPVIPCFLTLKDSDITGKDGFPVQEFTFNVLPVIYPDKNLTATENCENMRTKNFELWKNLYEEVYGLPLSYTTENPDNTTEG